MEGRVEKQVDWAMEELRNFAFSSATHCVALGRSINLSGSDFYPCSCCVHSPVHTFPVCTHLHVHFVIHCCLCMGDERFIHKTQLSKHRTHLNNRACAPGKGFGLAVVSKHIAWEKESQDMPILSHKTGWGASVQSKKFIKSMQGPQLNQRVMKIEVNG